VGSEPGASRFHLFYHFHHFTAEPQRLPSSAIFYHHILPLDFQWTPSNLQAMVNAVTERYPEEIPRAQGNNLSQPREPETP
jgi:hypothetical protein